LRNSGLNTPPSRITSTSGGGRNNQIKVHECSKLYKKLKYIKYNLREWNKEFFGNINQEKKNIEDKMRILQEVCKVEGYTEDRKKEEIPMTQEWEERC
jgi:hypothetical protein